MRFMNVLVSASVANVLYPLLFSVCTVAEVLTFVWLMVRVIGKTDAPVSAKGEAEKTERPFNFTALLLILLLIGLILRLIFVFAVKGYRPDVNTYINLFDHLKNRGFGDNYYTAYGTDVLPVTYYIYAFMGLFVNLFGLGTQSALMPLFVKLPLIAADLVTAFLLFKLAQKYLNTQAAVVVAGFVCVCPVFVFASGVWATQYSLFAMFAVLALYFLVQKNYVALIGCYAAAMLGHKDAIYLFPLVAVFVIYNYVKACMAQHAARHSFGEMMQDPATRSVFTVPVAIVGFAALSYLLALPLLLHSFGAGYFTFLYRLYLAPLATFGVFGHNSLGIFNLFMRNGVALNSRFPSVVFTVLFAVIVTGIVLLVYLSKKNRANLVYLAAYVIVTLATYFVGFTEFSLLAALMLFLMAFLLIRDKRILMIFGVLALAVTVNATAVMASAGYYNNLADYYVGIATNGSAVSDAYTGSLLLRGGATAVTIVCSAVAVLVHLYSTVVLLDISMSNKRKVLPYEENAGFGKAMAAFVRVKNK